MNCPICRAVTTEKFFIDTREASCNSRMMLWRCPGCGVIFSDDYGTDRAGLYGADYAAWGSASNSDEESEIAVAKKMAFSGQVTEILSLFDLVGSRALDVGAGNGYLMEILAEAGIEVWGTEISKHSWAICEKKFPGKIHLGGLKYAVYPDDFFDVVFMTDVLEHMADPKDDMSEVRRILRAGGYLFIISPNSGSMTRKMLGPKWFQYKYEHVFYFNKKSLEKLLESSGFRLVRFNNNHKKFTLSYYHAYFKKYSFLGVGRIMALVFPYLPKMIRRLSFSNPVTGEFKAIAQKK